ncbi:amino acid deaminase [Plantibacter sp. ME-Dv--P-122b]|uniref:amino acid deaminase n=1 Tax=Plantibacter sp. ME-Dv--P-122b TaxID=3040300 RepID=UPI002550E6D6|nr:amino acid deaminase [Plantibacter sp. ME-Dv--P-122b]
MTEPATVLEECSWLGAAIDDDTAAGRFASWGASTVIDEHTGGPVVPRVLFEALHARAGIAATWPVGNAGLLHVYGYLLSSVPTPYGLKRDRWLDGALARAFGLPDDEFVPWARASSLLSRVTVAAQDLLARPVRTADGPSGRMRLALGDRSETDAVALVYGIDERLITTFPVASASAVLEEWDAAPDRPRWNAAPAS